MLLLASVAVATLVVNASTRLRATAVALVAVQVLAGLMAAPATTFAQLALVGAGGITAAGILFVAARDARYGEDPGWRAWVATLLAVAATPVTWTLFRTVVPEAPDIPLIGGDPQSVIVQIAAFWLLTSGVAILVTARSAVRTTIGAALMLTAVQLLLRPATGPQLELTLAVAWLEVIVALVGAFLIVNERALRE